MGYRLQPVKRAVGGFEFGAFSWPVLLEACGYLFTSIHSNFRWYCAFGADERMGRTYPNILHNGGFRVTAFEAKVMARCARNFVAIQHTLPDSHAPGDLRSKETLDREDLLGALQRGLCGGPEVWPVKIRSDLTAKIAAFAEWADRSGGFRVY